MFHHASICVPDPEAAALGLAELLAADLLQAPCPPFPAAAWFVLARDQVGSMLEVLPIDIGNRRDAACTDRPSCAPPAWTQRQFLFSTSLSQAYIDATTVRLGWRSCQVDTGLFQSTQVWVQNFVPIELMTPAQANVYRQRFGLAERALLNERLRAIERGRGLGTQSHAKARGSS
jgi:hypothetical protein